MPNYTLYINPEIEKRISELQYDFESGSSLLIRKSIDIIIDFPDFFDQLTYNNFLSITDSIVNAKSSMAGIRYVINLLRKKYLESLGEKKISYYAKEIISSIDMSTKLTIKSATDHISKNFYNKVNIITSSYSNTFLKCLKNLKINQIHPIVFVVESIWQNRNYSENFVKSCGEIGIFSEILSFSDLLFLISKSDFVMTGADAVIPKHGMINGTPSLKLAENVNKRIPFFVIAESFKRTDEFLINDGYDLVPNELISKIFSDTIF